MVKRAPPECLPRRWFSADIAGFYYCGIWKLSTPDMLCQEMAVLLGDMGWISRPMMIPSELKQNRAKAESLTKKSRAVEFARPELCGRELLK